ncbi:MAG: hypothetical protein ACE5IM_12530 [Nitrospinota bacterium]
MNLFRSEEHAAAWQAEHGLAGEILSLEQARAWIAFIGKDRLRADYVHPRATGALGPFQQSIGLTGEFWTPSG